MAREPWTTAKETIERIGYHRWDKEVHELDQGYEVSTIRVSGWIEDSTCASTNQPTRSRGWY